MNSLQQNIILIGPMGAGKTSIGKQLAKMLNRPFYDVDREIEQQTGVDIPWIFDKEGELGFRRREQAMIERLMQLKDIVLATGGGAVTQANVRHLLSKSGYIIYLSASPEQQYTRICANNNRPMAMAKNKLQRLQSLQAEREKYYQSIAKLRIETDGMSVMAIMRRITDVINMQA